MVYICSLHQSYLMGCIIGVITQCIHKHIALALYVDKFYTRLILAQLLLPPGLLCSHLFRLTKVGNQCFVISINHKIMTQQYIFEMAKTIHNCKYLSICYTILILNVIKLITVEGHRLLYTIHSCKHYATSSNQGTINVDL